jgi:hypothetical protein
MSSPDTDAETGQTRDWSNSRLVKVETGQSRSACDSNGVGGRAQGVSHTPRGHAGARTPAARPRESAHPAASVSACA